MSEEHKVARLSDFTPGRNLAVKLGAREVALFMVDGEVLATAGRCPHANGPLHKGSVCEGRVTCAWHGWTFDLRTGACEESDDLVLARYEVRVQDDDVYVCA